MLRNLFSTTLCAFWRHKVQTGINIISLALGLAVFAFALLYVTQQLSYNRDWPEAERIHRLVVEQRGLPGSADGEFQTVNARAWPPIVDYFAGEFEAITRVTSSAVQIGESSLTTGANLHFVEPAFISIFPLDVIAGDLERTLSGPGFIALEETYAAAYGLDIAPGSRITIVGSQNESVEFEVGAIYRLPPNRSQVVNFRMLTLIHDYALPLFGTRRQSSSWENSVGIWLKLKPGIATEEFNALQPAFIQATVTGFNNVLGPDRRISDHLLYRWQPLLEVHFNPVRFEAGIQSGDMARVATFAVVGLLVLLVGCSNSVSLSLASAIERSKEVGIRKAVGALRRDIVAHSLGESLLLAMMALIPAIAILELLLPTFRTLMPFRLVLETGWSEYALLALITILAGLGSGVYPALVLSDVKPQAVMKCRADSGVKRGQGVRALLVGAQFCFASILLIGTTALYLQLAVTRAQPLGFNPEGLVFVFFGRSVQSMSSSEALHQELGKIPDVTRVAPAYTVPATDTSFLVNAATLIDKNGSNEEIKAQMIPVSHDFLDLVQIPLLAGRGYDVARDRMDAQAPRGDDAPVRNSLVNRSTTKALGFPSPEAAVGQMIDQRFSSNSGQMSDAPVHIIGVVEDNMYGSLRRLPGPEIYLLMPETVESNFMLRYESSAESTLQEKINEVAQRVTNAPAQSFVFVEPRIAGAFKQEQNESKLLFVCGGLALLLACMGLYGLAAFLMERGIKEVGVRKVLGAGMGSIVTLFLWRFAWPVLAANLIAWPVAVYFILQWTARFPYQIDKSWLLPLCLCASAVVLLVAVMTIGTITARAAGRQPVRSLRYE